MELPQLERDYDVAAASIQCRADKISARVFLVPAMNASDDDVRVLAFDKETAAYCGRHYAVERAALRYMNAPLSGVEVVED